MPKCFKDRHMVQAHASDWIVVLDVTCNPMASQMSPVSPGILMICGCSAQAICVWVPNNVTQVAVWPLRPWRIQSLSLIHLLVIPVTHAFRLTVCVFLLGNLEYASYCIQKLCCQVWKVVIYGNFTCTQHKSGDTVHWGKVHIISVF
jgi:hypothetical protein